MFVVNLSGFENPTSFTAHIPPQQKHTLYFYENNTLLIPRSRSVLNEYIK